MSERDTINRRPFRAIGLKMPRCSLRFGVGPCTATGTPKCHNLRATCKDTENYTPTGSVEYVFVQDDVEFFDCYKSENNGNDIRTGGIPALTSAQAKATELNLAGQSEGSTAIGTRSTISASISSFPDSLVQPWVDYYLADRGPIKADFWQVLSPRTNDLFPGAEVFDYQGYVGDALEDMQKRRYLFNAITVPREGRVRIEGRDPIMKALETEYPRATEITLVVDIDAVQTGGIQVSAQQADLADAFGNTGNLRLLTIGREIISYTGFTATGGNWTLTGVQRAQVGTEAAQHKTLAACQRAAYHSQQSYYQALRYIIDNHTPIPSDTLDGDSWDEEGNRFLGAALMTGVIAAPMKFTAVASELTRDGKFSMWYDERTGKMKIRALRAPYPPTDQPVTLTDESNIELMSPQIEVAPDERITRVNVLFDERSPTGRGEFANYETRRIIVDAETENPEVADNGIIPKRIESRWIRTRANALGVGVAMLKQYRLPPKYVTIRVDAKDRDINTGTVVDLKTRLIIDSEGEPVQLRWVVRSCYDVDPGTRVELHLQSYGFAGRYAVIMPNNTPSYNDATQAQRDFGCFIAETATKRLPNGDEPYLIY
jgi:hypothetical protein